MIVRVNDRGPYASDRVMDVSRRVAEALDFKRYGTARIKVEYVGHASLAGSDDARLLATLRTDGPARWRGDGAPTMLAEERPPARVASLAPYVPAERPVVVAEAPPPRRRVAPVLVRAAWPEAPPPRAVARPLAVEAAYQRFGVVRAPRAPRAPAPDRSSYARYDASRERARFEIARAGSSRRDDPPRLRLAARDVAPHLPIRDLLPPPRYDRGEPPLRPLRFASRMVMPPSRPIDVAEPSRRHRLVEVRAVRYRDD